ncbi:nucleoside triphosphate pyrophosphohydrolase [Marinicella gelatinilytica]|uniref:nucleoside triphosphate pyrophosphohydrolase n=1 Tax=Marinicella gelatinilytica TaxID=2996017 RepID=UPI002260BA1E|nr:nucleoside triphosphate pyrophosphohydrolase [Marinicella gelatinilytica]MCX7545103.1 nucleoside triphosphate pyrophosphohydrolase [Marinicella gelatinilytica]
MDNNIDDLLTVMARLRDPQHGCPWDLAQDFNSIAPYTVEEAYEVADAIAEQDWVGLKEELGDLLFQVVFHARMAEEQGLFSFSDVVNGLCQKMIDRHPHVFDETQTVIRDAKQQTEAWEKQKNQHKDSVFDGIAKTFPELLKAMKMHKAAATIGFDWPDIVPVFDKLDEEKQELIEALQSGDQHDIEGEVGDLLMVCTSLARHAKVDPEMAMRKANQRFDARFRIVEQLAKQEQPGQDSYDLDYLDSLWLRAKQQLGQAD